MNLPQGSEILFLVIVVAFLVALVMWWVRRKSSR
jgi:membrane protein DedA with SNARE-associated domain